MIDIISILRQNLPRFQKVLELRSGKGADLKLLNEYYEVVASEDTKVKTRYLKDEFIDIRVILLDNITMDTHKKFDCVFSRNVFDDNNLFEISQSFKNQKKVLNEKGLIFHIFDSNKVDKNEILTLLNEDYELIECKEVENIFYTLGKVC